MKSSSGAPSANERMQETQGHPWFRQARCKCMVSRRLRAHAPALRS